MVFFWDFMGERGFNMNAVGSEGAPPLVSRCLREATAYHGVVESVPPCGIPQTFAYTILVYIYIFFDIFCTIHLVSKLSLLLNYFNIFNRIYR